MLLFICVLIALLASFVGSISGIGGGIIIKPVLDLTGRLPIETVNFLSGVTVLTMTVSSLVQNRLNSKKNSATDSLSSDKNTDAKKILSLCGGSVLGGFIGSELFTLFVDGLGDQKKAVLIQAICIFLITLIVMIYQWNIKRIKPLDWQGLIAYLGVGLVLGVISSFLGIGGGPLNVAVLAFFFAMSPKVAALNSLAVILSAQLISLLSVIIQNKVPEFDVVTLIAMMISGVVGALIGRFFATKMDNTKTRKFFNIVLVLILLINLYNVVKQFTV